MKYHFIRGIRFFSHLHTHDRRIFLCDTPVIRIMTIVVYSLVSLFCCNPFDGMA